jgi:hypothetical protein
VAAGLVGALSFGEELRYPALAPARDTVPHRPGFLIAKLVVCGMSTLLLALVSLFLNTAAAVLLFGDAVPSPADWSPLAASAGALTVGCSWAGLLGAGVFQSTAFGLTAVLAVPLGAVPVLEDAMTTPWLKSLAELPQRLRAEELQRLPVGLERVVAVLVRLVSQPVGQAMVLSLVVLVCVYTLAGLRGRTRQ